jgi:hypothetical protein
MTYETNPREYAIEQIVAGVIDPTAMLIAALKYMSTDDVAEMLDMNEMSPRFSEEDTSGLRACGCAACVRR